VTGDQPTERTLTVADITELAGELAAYHASFAPLFTRFEQRGWAGVYLRGLLTADVPHKNVEALALRLFAARPEAARTLRALQQFVGEGGWEDAAILATHCRLVDAGLGEDDGVLIIDGSDFLKQGSHSAGVARQWCRHRGKKDNCQVGVVLGYASRTGYTLLDRRLYLPGKWFSPEFRERWRAARIPEGTPFRTKHELAAELVGAATKGDQRARWVVCDEGYGATIQRCWIGSARPACGSLPRSPETPRSGLWSSPTAKRPGRVPNAGSRPRSRRARGRCRSASGWI
jgi:SRSO17 transposase